MYERGRNGVDQYQPDAQEFLTFRNNQSPIEGTGRSVFSQQADYRSLEKHHDMIQASSPLHRNLKNVRSQEKYRMARDQQVLTSLGEQSQQETGKELMRTLKRKESQLLKKIKGEERKAGDLDREIESIKQELGDIKAGIEVNEKAIVELRGIEDENESFVEMMEEKKMVYEEEASQFRQIYSETEVQIETARTSRDQPSFDLQKKLQAGIGELTRFRDVLSDSIQHLARDIEQLTLQLEQARQIDALIGERSR